MRTLLFVILVAVSLFSCVREDGGEDETINYINVGDEVPQFVVMDNSTVSVDFSSPADFLEKNTLLAFFTTACPHCRREMPFVEYAYRQLSEDGLTVIPIGRGETYSTMIKYWEDLNLSIPRWFIDPDRAAFDKFANQTVPRFYLVGEDAKVVWMKVGELAPGDFTEEKGNKFIELIKQKLNL